MSKKIRVFAPEVISLYKKQYAIQTLFFIEQLYAYEADVIIVDFSKTKHITCAAEVVLLAHINAIQLLKNNSGCFQFDCKNSSIYQEFFIREGYLNDLKQLASRYKKGESFKENELRKIGTVNQFAMQRGMNLQDIVEFEAEFKAKMKAGISVINLSFVDTFFRSLKTAVSEILINIKNHAYEDGSVITEADNQSFDPYVDKPWWQMAWYSPQTRQITFILCDIGLGLVDSYTKHATNERKNIFEKVEDAFKETISEGKSRFIGGGRGNGLSNMIKIAKENMDASLSIFSGEMACMVKEGKESFFNLEGNRLPGTVIEWVFQLPKWS